MMIQINMMMMMKRRTMEMMRRRTEGFLTSNSPRKRASFFISTLYLAKVPSNQYLWYQRCLNQILQCILMFDGCIYGMLYWILSSKIHFFPKIVSNVVLFYRTCPSSAGPSSSQERSRSIPERWFSKNFPSSSLTSKEAEIWNSLKTQAATQPVVARESPT